MLDVITKEEFQIWRGTPLTQKMFKYFSDRAEFIKTAWVNGEFPSDQVGEAMVEARAMIDLTTLEYSDILKFYNIEEIEEKNAEQLRNNSN